MKAILILPVLVLLLAALLSGCASEPDLAKAQAKAEKLFRKELKKKNVHNAFLAVYSPTHEIDWNLAGGQFRDGATVTTATPFHTASIGKTFTATATALLAEEGKVAFDAPIDRYLPEEIIQGLHVLDGRDYSRDITIAHLLQHTSGLSDYFEGETIDGSPNFLERIFADTARFWEPVELIQFTKEKMRPKFPPGQGYHYTDTEYILLGLIVERVGGMPLPAFFRKNFFEPLDLKRTAMHLRSLPIERTGPIAELYLGDLEGSTMTSLSADWAGGGITATTSDLIRFQSALNAGEIISQNTLQGMQKWTPETKGMYYGFGLRKIAFRELFPLLPKLEVVGHSGLTGSFMYYCPELDVYLAGTLNQTEEVRNSVVLMVKVLSLIKKNIPR